MKDQGLGGKNIFIHRDCLWSCVSHKGTQFLNFLISISLLPVGVNLLYLKPRLFDLTELIVCISR